VWLVILNTILKRKVPLEAAEFFRLNKERKLKIIDQVKRSVSGWRNVANMYQLPKDEQELMTIAFNKFL